MGVESPRGSQRIRARRDSAVNGQGQHSAFRVEDENGRVLRRIRSARHAQEAIALYWRTVGAMMPEVMMGKDLDRRISRARAANSRERMETPELPFETQSPLDEGEEMQDGGGMPTRARQSRPRQVVVSAPQSDLFGEASAAVPVEPIAEPAPEIKPEPRSSPEPRLVDAHTVMLQQVDSRNLLATDRADSYLYHVTNGQDAEAALRNGLTVSTSDPMILTERQGVGYWLSVLAEDYDYIMDGPANFVVLRMRRIAVEELLEHDPHASRSAGCPCYLLTGGAASRGQDEAARRS